MSCSEDCVFAVLEQRSFEAYGVVPSPDNDAIVGSALVVWSDYYVCVLKSTGKQTCPIAVLGAAIEHVVLSLPSPSHILLMPETQEVYQAFKMSKDILDQHRESRSTAVSRSGFGSCE
jgi:hypothetical protein